MYLMLYLLFPKVRTTGVLLFVTILAVSIDLVYYYLNTLNTTTLRTPVYILI